MPGKKDLEGSDSFELLYPMYLDTDMSMAFAAALAGGIALEQETVEHDQSESSAVRNLRGNLRLFDVVGASGGRSTTDSDSSSTESRMIRRHTEASIFIALNDELQRRGLVRQASGPNTAPGSLVAMELGPATAPLRRVLEQLLRLFELTHEDAPPPPRKQQRNRTQGGNRPAQISQAADTEAADVRGLLKALKSDLDHSGMTDVVVRRDDDLSVVLTLDNRFVTTQTLELLHTSTFTVVGKVTQVWPTSDDVANLYRRSVLALLPALTEAAGWMFMGMLGGLAGSIDVQSLQREARQALGLPQEEQQESSGEVRLGDDFQALLPAVTGPALQILPLAICA